jgi:RNA polymerase sigma factor (sigma-70 family)
MSAAPQTRPTLLLRLRDIQDEEAWREFVSLYTPLVFGHCRQQGLQEADAADVAQEVMRTVAQVMPDFDYDSKRGLFRSWLFQTTRHRLHRFFERQQRVPRPASETVVERFLDREPCAEEEKRWEEEHRQRLFDWAAEKARPEFKPTTWEAFWLTAVESFPVKDAAAKAGISLWAVYIARSRVMARLRELIESVGDGPLPTTRT